MTKAFGYTSKQIDTERRNDGGQKAAILNG
jgi:hypothetical protein